MKEVFDLIIENPTRAFAFVMMIACVALVSFIAKLLYVRFEENEEKIKSFSDAIESSFERTSKMIEKHSIKLTLATRSIHSDITEIQDNLYNLKKDLLERTAELEQYARDLEHKTLALSHVFEVNIEKYADKFGAIIDLRKELETTRGRVERVEGDRRQIGELQSKIEALGKVLRIHEDRFKGKK